MTFFSYIIPYGLVYWAEQFVPSGLAAVIFGVYPFFILIFSYFALPGETIGFYKVLGITLGFTGIVVIFSDQLGGDVSGYLLGMAALVLSGARSEEHTSELQSRPHLVCRLLLEKKKQN